MWRVLLDLLTAVRRPLVIKDFETCGLSGAPPVEFATLIWAPWRAPEDDEVTRLARLDVPEGLTYACVQRLNPGMPIPAEATRVHGITDADVKDCPAWNDLEVRGYFQGLAAGDAAEGEGPAIFVGHNIANADLPWARKWGYLPPDEVDAVDTLRLYRRLSKEMPHPMMVDVEPCRHYGDKIAPVIQHGLDCYSGTVAGMHLGLVGERPMDAHGAFVDASATARVFCRVLDLWSPLWPPKRADVPASANLTALLACLDTPPPGQVSWDGWLTQRDDGFFVWVMGKRKGQLADYDRSIIDMPRSPTGDDAKRWWCSQHTADILAGVKR